MVLAHRFDRSSPVLMTDLDRGAIERGLGLAVELLAPRAKRSRVVIEKFPLFQPSVDGVTPDRERAAGLRTEDLLQPHRVLIERVGGRLGGGKERALRGAIERRR